MLVTDKFVYIHQPKTGGTFVTAMVTQAHEARGDLVETIWIEPDAMARLPDVGPHRLLRVMMTTRNQHGARRDIPPQYRNRQLVATVRNPYDRYVSQFEFAWWRVYPEMFGPVDDVRRNYPHYPDLTFDDFVALTNTVSVPYRPDGHPARTPGFQTQQFVEYFCREPQTTYPKLATDAVGHPWDEELRDIAFLDQERLNGALYAFLIEMGYEAELVEPVRHSDRIVPGRGRTDGSPWQAYFPPGLKAFVRQKEDLLFRLFPQFDR